MVWFLCCSRCSYDIADLFGFQIIYKMNFSDVCCTAFAIDLQKIPSQMFDIVVYMKVKNYTEDTTSQQIFLLEF